MIDYGRIARDSFALEAQLASESNAHGWTAPTDAPEPTGAHVRTAEVDAVAGALVEQMLADMRAEAVAAVESRRTEGWATWFAPRN